ncbi:MAG: hypothetical protein AAF570_20155, partial [Bacteroidota bacterium]
FNALKTHFKHGGLHKQDLSTERSRNKAMFYVSEALSSLRAAYQAAMSFWTAIGSEVAAEALTTVPILGIAANIANVILRGYYFLQSLRNYLAIKMGEIVKGVAGGVDVDKEKVDSDVLFRRQTTMKQFAWDNEAREATLRHQKSGDVSDLFAAHRARGMSEEFNEPLSAPTSSGLAPAKIQELDVAKKIQEINKKRMTRQFPLIVAEISKAVGSVALLTPGAAPAAPIFSGIGSAVSPTMTLMRETKRKARERARIAQMQDKFSIFSLFADGSKARSTTKFAYEQYSRFLLDRLMRFVDHDFEKGIPPELNRTVLYFKSLGIDINSFLEVPDAQLTEENVLNAMMEAFKRREPVK